MGGQTRSGTPFGDNLAQLQAMLQSAYQGLTTPVNLPNVGAAPLQDQTGMVLELIRQAVNMNLLNNVPMPGPMIRKPFENVTSKLNKATKGGKK